MPDPGRNFDQDTPRRRSPRLYGDIDRAGGRPVEPITFRPRPTPLQLARLRRDLAIYLAIEGGMSQRVAAKVFGLSQPGILKAYRRMLRRKSRV